MTILGCWWQIWPFSASSIFMSGKNCQRNLNPNCRQHLEVSEAFSNSSAGHSIFAAQETCPGYMVCQNRERPKRHDKRDIISFKSLFCCWVNVTSLTWSDKGDFDWRKSPSRHNGSSFVSGLISPNENRFFTGSSFFLFAFWKKVYLTLSGQMARLGILFKLEERDALHRIVMFQITLV